MMNSLVLLLGIVALTMSGIAMLALRRAREASAHCANLELLIIDADQRCTGIEAHILHLTKTGRKTLGRVDKLAADRGRLTSNVDKSGFGEAIALIQHGATARQLIDTCGISRAEAHLVETLYGKTSSATSADAANKYCSPNKFVLVDAHLEVAEHRPSN